MTPATLAADRFEAIANDSRAAPPPGRWFMYQRWEELLFCSWPAPAEILRPLIPPELEIDVAEGTAWLSIVPFLTPNVELRGVPPTPDRSSFPEVNLRTYVKAGGASGIWFLSLDTNDAVTVAAGRDGFHLPYFLSEISMDREEWRTVRSSREDEAVLDVRYRPIGSPFAAAEGTLEHFLAERYSAFSQSPEGELYRVDIRHAPWQLQGADMDLRAETIVRAAGIDLSLPNPLTFYSAAADVLFWPPVRAI
jgi:uncharacterized protein YqjF (DUF2071 family)